MRLKRIYEYLGDNDTQLDARATASCGQTVSGGDPIAAAVGTPQEVAFGFAVDSIDCAVISPNKYVVIVVKAVVGARHVWGAVVTVTGGTTISIGTPVLIDNTVNTYAHVSVCALSETAIFISAFDSTGNNQYGISCSVGSGTITRLGTSNMTPVYAFQTMTKVIKISTTSVLLAFKWSGAPYHGHSRVVVVSVSGATITFNTPVSISTSSGTKFDLEDSATAGQFFFFGLSDATDLTNRPMSISGTTITPGTVWGALGHNTGSTDNDVSYLDDGVYTNAAIRGAGARVTVANSSGLIATKDTTDQTFFANIDIVGSTLDRFYLAYATDNSGTANDKLEIEAFTYDGLSTITSHSVTSIATGGTYDSINFANDGLSPTKVPLVYRDNANLLGKPYTLVLETGTS